MNNLNAFIEAYESAQAQGSAKVSDFPPEPRHPLYRPVLLELVRVDLEYSWKRGRPQPLENYLNDFPRLKQEGGAVQELAFEEYRLRHQAGQNPSPAEYRRRFQVDPDSWPRLVLEALPPGQGDAGSAPHAGAWEMLERFLKEISKIEEAAEQVELALPALRDSLGADAVFHWSAEAAAASALVGPAGLSPTWCRDFAQQTLIAHGPGSGQLLLPPLPLPKLLDGPAVHSAAFVRLGKTGPTWLVALSFGSRSFAESDLKIMMLVRRMLLNQRQHTQTYAQLKDALFSVIRCLTAAIDARDPYTCGHSERVARIAVCLGRQMGLPVRAQSDLYLAGLLHDVGKIGIRDEVLLKKGKLSPEEYAHIQEHAVIGDRIVGTIKQLASLRPGVRHHHERIDGQGYPDRLAGKNIPLQARVLAIADACDAMMSARPYRPAMPTRQIDEVMTTGAGSQWDAEVVKHFMACRQELYAICQRGLGLSVIHAVEQVLQDAGQGSSIPSPADTAVTEG